MGRFLALALASLLVACSASAKIRPDQLAALRRGQTTYVQVVDSLGPPSIETIRADNAKVAYWTSKDAGEHDIFGAKFDENGVLQDYKTIKAR